MIERKLVTIRKINELNPIPKADAIECAKIDGWNVVVRKGEFEVGDPCIFIEIDSVLPDDLEAFRFLIEKQGKTFYNGKFGARLKTVRLRGQLSQGLALPIDTFGKTFPTHQGDLAEILGVWKYDPPPPAGLEGLVAGSWPAWLPKTDQERVQNLDPSELTGEYIIEEKMDGTSMSVWIDEHGTLGVGSRNLSLKIDETNSQNMYVRMAHESGLLNHLKTNVLPQDAPLAIQGELCGPGIQGNPYGLDRVMLFVFDVYKPNMGGKLEWHERDQILEDMQLRGVKIASIPWLGIINLSDIDGDKIAKLLNEAEGQSLIGRGMREGIVLKSATDGNKSFKVISNGYLLNQND